MILDLITPFRATINKDPEYNVQIKSVYPIRHVPYKPDCGDDSFEIMQKNMAVTVIFIDGTSAVHVCDRVIEEFDKLLLIRNFQQVGFELVNVESVVVE